MNNTPPRYDIDGFDEITAALRVLINSYPALDGDKITFSALPADGGKSWYPLSGAIIEREQKSITGNVRQICAYPFQVIYRAFGLNESRKAAIKEQLDALGAWLEHTEYPKLTGNRKFVEIRRTTPAYLAREDNNNCGDWEISITARYENLYETGA